MPMRARASGEARLTSWPAKLIRPVVGMVSPAKQLKNVDFPAPFGPIRPTISFSSTVRLASDTARKLPNALETFCASSSMTAHPALRRNAVPQIEHSARLETRDQHDDAAIDNVGQ